MVYKSQFNVNFKDLDKEDAKILSWFLVGLRHEAIRLLKKEKKLKQHEILILNDFVNPDDSKPVEMINTISDPTDPFSEVEDKIYIQQVLSVLTLQQRKVIELIIFKGLTEKEIAKQLGISQPSVHRLKIRGLNKIKNIIYISMV
ncbi:sigma-70 family RNA polymerase sigma factor [Thermosediminibacter oceani]|uniref:Sigma-70 region 4 type 2 n=1 Tax=Thermosediminibacter oceani (strain ATCC BAA-1034 / DSM 16646 / JW/IW-1228P) TaxID=555079 RepID=D9RYF2_THEOJ|nr:sigma-70 family RNA polymerase sigma factor [Thermosediminibacter oceani]ADL08376.1 Sigma-70 region 4 type 2 [Thermosediminibacter oceani DSM 16646]